MISVSLRGLASRHHRQPLGDVAERLGQEILGCGRELLSPMEVEPVAEAIQRRLSVQHRPPRVVPTLARPADSVCHRLSFMAVDSAQLGSAS